MIIDHKSDCNYSCGENLNVTYISLSILDFIMLKDEKLQDCSESKCTVCDLFVVQFYV